MNINRDCIKGIGISENFPENSRYFTQISITEIVKVPDAKPDIEQVLSIMVEPEIMSLKVVDTPCIKSYEGQLLSGKKIIIELKLTQKVTYIADEPTQSVHAAHFEKTARSIFIVVPKTINGISIEKLIDGQRLEVTPYIEDICGEQIDKRSISKCITLFLDVALCD